MRWARLLDALFPAACIECDAMGSGLCEACFPVTPSLRFSVENVQCFALGRYEGALRHAVLGLKSGRRDVGEALGARLSILLTTLDADALVPIPTTSARRRRRGFDQAVLLAQHAGRQGGVAVLPLLRHSGGHAQHGRSRLQRLAAAGRFVCDRSVGAAARVVIIDDVVTTGASLCDAAAALRVAGSSVVAAAFVARTDEGRSSHDRGERLG